MKQSHALKQRIQRDTIEFKRLEKLARRQRKQRINGIAGQHLRNPAAHKKNCVRRDAKLAWLNSMERRSKRELANERADARRHGTNIVPSKQDTHRRHTAAGRYA